VLTTLNISAANMSSTSANTAAWPACAPLQLSPCENTCPLNMNIPGFLQLLKEDRLDDAFEQVVMDNPLPSTTGRVCQHPCEIRCRRAGVDASVNMRETHRYIADVAYEGDLAKKVLKRILKRKKGRHPQKNRRGRRRSGRPQRRVLSRVARPQGHRL
jgi:NADPH-dependent glutamate synthase beta subunit-like oxidoreductase